MSDTKLILVGQVGGAFGVRGEVRITAYTAEPMALLDYGVLLRADGSVGLTLTSARPDKNGVVARVKEIATKEEADALTSVLDAREKTDLDTAYDVVERGRRPREYAPALRDLEKEQKSRERPTPCSSGSPRRRLSLQR